jgi:tRNA(Ile)-lysidine synthase
MSSTPPSLAPVSPAEAAFLAALAAGLPATHDWAFPSLVGVSGGADSVALALGLVRLAPADAARQLVIAHADHGLRADSAADHDFVATLAERLGVRFVGRRLAVAAAAGREGLEGRARRLRYEFLAAAAHEAGARHVLVAHTADDQAETILHRMLRGTGVAGLAGMRRSRRLADGVALVRPLLHVSRASVRDFLAAVGQDWREDATNADLRHARNFLRHEILPRCEAGPYPAATDAIVRLGAQAAMAAAAVASAAEHLLDAHSSRRDDGTVVLRTASLAALDRHLLAELFVRLWDREGWPRRDMTARHYGQLVAVATAGDTAAAGTADFPGGVRVSTTGIGQVSLRPPG